jgi:hypothetical protein
MPCGSDTPSRGLAFPARRCPAVRAGDKRTRPPRLRS